MSQELLKNWLEQIAVKSDIHPDFDEQGIFSVVLNNEILLSIMVSEKRSDHFVFLTVLTTLSGNPSQDHQLMKKAMKLNYFQQETLGGNISMGPNPSVISYILSYPFEECDHQGFENLMENYLKAAVTLKEKLSHSLSNDPKGQREKEIPLPNFAMRV